MLEQSLRETCRTGAYFYREIDALPVQPDAKVYCWYGEKECGMKKGIQKLRRLYPSLVLRRFAGYGHGEVMGHPEQMAEGIREIIKSAV